MVVEDGDRLVGVLSLKDLMGFLSLKIDLEGDGTPPLVPEPEHETASRSA